MVNTFDDYCWNMDYIGLCEIEAQSHGEQQQQARKNKNMQPNK